MSEAGEKIMSMVAEAGVVAIAGHVNPDGDAIGACYAMAMSAAKMWKSVFVFLDDYSGIFDCIPGRDFRFTGGIESVMPDIFIALDCGSIDRLGRFGELFGRSAVTVNIDHHASNTYFAEHNLVEEDASSTCQIIFDLINMYVPIDAEIAAALYAGLLYDTGGFRHRNTTAKAHEVAGRLIGVGFDHSGIYNELMHVRSEREAKCFGKALGNIKVTGDGRIASCHLTARELTELGATGRDLEGIAEYLLGIRGAEASVFAYARGENETKFSFRSKNIDVGKIARELGGGGHVNAAGAYVAGGAEEAERRAVEILTQRL